MPRLGAPWTHSISVLPPLLSALLQVSIGKVESAIDAFCSSEAGDPRPQVILSDSPLFLPLCYREGALHTIEIPIGFFIRVQLLLHLSLRHLDDHANFVLMASHHSPRQAHNYYLPIRFQPIFGPYDTVSSLLASTSAVMERFPLVGVHVLQAGLAFKYSCLAMIFHELTHVTRDHVGRIAEGRSRGRILIGETGFELREALEAFELEADTWAARWTFQEAVAQSYGLSPTAQFRALVTGWMAVFSLFDTPERYLRSVEGTCYCHPAVRYEFVRGVWDYYAGKEQQESFAEVEYESWRTMIYCMDRAVISSLMEDPDVNGKVEAGVAILPFHSFNFGVTEKDKAIFEEDYKLHAELLERYRAAWK